MPAEPAADSHSSDLYVRQLVLRDVRESAREVDFIASTDAVDSYGEIVVQNWDLKRYTKNPVILWSHNSWDLPIGQAVRCEVVKGKLECTIRFASEKANPKAELVWQGILEKTLRAVSVGFMPRDIRYEKHNDVEVCMLDDNELREISVVTLPANPEALAKAKAEALAVFRAAAPPAPTQEPTNLSAAERGKTEKTDMDPKDLEIAALKAKMAERDAEIGAARAKAVEAEKAAAAEAAKRESEKDTKIKALELQTENLAKERDAEKAARAIADGQLIELEVGGLVGKKITPAEKDTFVKLRKSDKGLFDEMVSQRSEMTHDKQIIADDKAAPPPVDKTAASDVSEAAALADFEKSLAN